MAISCFKNLLLEELRKDNFMDKARKPGTSYSYSEVFPLILYFTGRN